MVRSAVMTCPTHSESETAERLSNYSKVTKALNQLTDEQLSELLTSATPLGSGIGGDVLSLEGEEAFFKKHIDYDRYYVVTELAKNAIAATVPNGGDVLDTYLSGGKMTVSLPSAISSITERYRPIAVLMEKFFRGLQTESKSTPYPKEELEREWTKK